MICTGYNQHITDLLMRQLVLWRCTLSNGLEVYSDFDVPGQKDPWVRLRHYCYNNNVGIIKVEALVPGNPAQTIFEDPYGLNDILLIRGMSKDISVDGETTYAFMTFGKIEDDGLIHISRYYWPECKFAVHQEIREITPENELLIYRKRLTCECK